MAGAFHIRREKKEKKKKRKKIHEYKNHFQHQLDGKQRKIMDMSIKTVMSSCQGDQWGKSPRHCVSPTKTFRCNILLPSPAHRRKAADSHQHMVPVSCSRERAPHPFHPPGLVFS